MAAAFSLTATNGGEKSAVVFADAPGAETPSAGQVILTMDSTAMTKADALEQLRNIEARIVELGWPADS